MIILCCFSDALFAAKYNSAAAVTNARLGLAYLSKGFYTQSKERLLSALRDDPAIAAGWYSMAFYLEKTGNNMLAEKYYRKAIAVEPHSGSAKNNYGTFLCRSGRYPESIHYFVQAANEKTYLDSAGAYENAGICALMMKDNKAATQYFHQALQNNPSMPFSLLNMAKLSHLNGDDSAAEKYFVDFKEVALNNKSAATVQRYQQYVFSNAIQNNSQSNITLPQPK